MSIIKIPDNIWYIQRGDEDTLAYMSYDDHTKGCAKKKETGRRWAGQNSQEDSLANVPVQGFALGDAVSRYSTSNKLVRVTDPRGFTVELFIHNLCQVLANCTVVKGVIQEECRWGQNGSGHTLIPVGSDMERVVEFMLELKRQKKPKFTELNLGDRFVSPQGDINIYNGIYEVQGDAIMKVTASGYEEVIPFATQLALYTPKDGNGYQFKVKPEESRKHVLGVMEGGTPTEVSVDTMRFHEFNLDDATTVTLQKARKTHRVQRYYGSTTQIKVKSIKLIS